jgi:hypothetical protein
MSEEPLLKARNMSPMSLMDNAIATKLETLSKLQQQQYLCLHNNFQGKMPSVGLSKPMPYLVA